MQEINLPKRFQEKLNNSDKKFNAIIFEILSHYETILNISKLEFFPEYNDHGIIHLNNIFKIQDKLITKESFVLMTIEDIITLIVSTVSHDIGMHLNYEGFQTLLTSDLEHSKVWNKNWNIFLQKAKKYNENKLVQIFGDTNPVLDLPKNKQDLKNRDYLLVGEFLRINHPKLAEDILKYGFPISNGKYLQLSNKLNECIKVLNFSSLLAKSHGMNVRDTFKEIQDIGHDGDLQSPYNIHIIYLMIVLRLSDYLDIYINRHPKIILGLKNFMSNISIMEWDKNTAVTDIKDHWKDKEAIFIGVEPKDSISFINLKNLFKSIQYEFDMSWAILGEVYSKEEQLKCFAIKYRRILSTIDDEVKFSKTVNYIPKNILFKSDPELLKLLIAPLYGDDPSYGIRELLQNSIDACKEYRELIDDSDYNPIVDIKLLEENNKYTFEIIDNGLGMTEDTIINYFLKAGASFRNSDFWIENLKDDNNKAKIIRTGRFGVGLLAVFLLGNKITVNTRHYQSDYGYTFNSHLSDSQINIYKNHNISIGTSIKIDINKKIYDKLTFIDRRQRHMFDLFDGEVYNWQKWYMLDDIIINYQKNKPFFHDEIEVTTIDKIINETSYIEINQNEYTSIKWFFENIKQQLCTCNGFKIPNGKITVKSTIDIPSTSKRIWDEGYTNNFNNPSYLITDKEGKLPLSLSRDTFLNEEFSFNDTLIKSFSSELFNYLVNYKIDKNSILSMIYLNHPLFIEKNWQEDIISHTTSLYKKFIFNNNGFNLFNSYTIEKNKIDRLIFIEFNDNEESDYFNKYVKELLDNNIYLICNHSNISGISGGYSYILKILEQSSISLDKAFEIKSANIIIPKDKFNKLFTFKNTYLTKTLKNQIIPIDKECKKYKKTMPIEEESKKWVRNYYIKKEDSLFNLYELDNHIDNIGLITEIFIDYENPKTQNIEYYFYNLMAEHFKYENNYLIQYSD